VIHKVQDWRDWTYPDGSFKKHEEGQDTGSGVPPLLMRIPLREPKRHRYNQVLKNTKKGKTQDQVYITLA
jgi:hypothetical protein